MRLSVAQDVPLSSSANVASKKAQVHVVILAGGFNCQLVQQVHDKVARDTLAQDSCVSMLRTTTTRVQHIPAGLVTIGAEGHGLANTVNQLYTAHQINPLQQSLYLVTNSCNHDEYTGSAGFFDDIGRFPREWQDKHVICNGCTQPSDWKGHVNDLALAVQHISKEHGELLDCIAIDANLFFWPDFNIQEIQVYQDVVSLRRQDHQGLVLVQKLVSNMVVRASNTIAIATLSDVDEKLMLHPVLTVIPADETSVPRLSTVVSAAPAAGSCVLLPVSYLTVRSLEMLTDVIASVNCPQTLPDLFQFLHSSAEPVFGARVPWGIFDTSCLLCLQYVHECMLYFARNSKYQFVDPSAHVMKSDTITTLLQECDDTGLGKSRMYDRQTANSLMADVQKGMKRAFDEYFFAFHNTRFRGMQLPAYKLPSTFYMTEYRVRSCEPIL